MNKVVFVFLICFMFYGCDGEAKQKKSSVQTTAKKNVFKAQGKLKFLSEDGRKLLREVTIELAETPYRLMTGLMYREELGADEGMLFIFDQSHTTSFYMKNTLIPLDIVFIDENQQIINIGYGNPLDETPIPSKEPCLYVLEVNQGFMKQHQIEKGDFIAWERL